MSFDDDISIDKFNLDEEWLKQSILYNEWGKNYAQTVLERDRARQKVELVRAELDSEIRSDFKSFGLEKITEAAINNTIPTIEKYKIIIEEMNQAIYNVNVFTIARETLDHKRAALENLTKLFLAGYWAEGKSISKIGQKMIEENVQKEQQQQLNKRMKLNNLKKKI